MWLIVGAAVAALVASHLSQYTKAEVERIWLLFYPWIAVAAASMFVAGKSATENRPSSDRGVAPRLGRRASNGAIVLQSALVTKW